MLDLSHSLVKLDDYGVQGDRGRYPMLAIRRVNTIIVRLTPGLGTSSIVRTSITFNVLKHGCPRFCVPISDMGCFRNQFSVSDSIAP